MRPRPRAVENRRRSLRLRRSRSPSMRPRPRAVENAPHEAAQLSDIVPSMRPRPVPWRTTAAGVIISQAEYAFNAATAFVPWRTSSASPPERRPARAFNAATAFVPWRTAHRLRVPDRPYWAFNAATASCRGEPRRQSPMAHASRTPSMRPRPSCRGEPTAYASGSACRAYPSMRPRPRAVENVHRLTRHAAAGSMRLQCGHGLRAVENHRARLPSTDAAASLQCGHGLGPWRTSCDVMLDAAALVPSMRPRPRGRGERMRRWPCRLRPMAPFNAATASKAVENRASAIGSTGGNGDLQCGHGLEGRGEPDQSGGRAWHADAAFNAATARAVENSTESPRSRH